MLNYTSDNMLLMISLDIFTVYGGKKLESYRVFERATKMLIRQ